MNEQFIESEVEKYNSIEIPSSLDLKVRQSLKLAKKKRRNIRAIKFSTGVAAFFIFFTFTVNIFPQVANALSSLPVLDKVISFITFDKGLENAVKKGEYQEIDYSEEKNGVKLTITSIAGDRGHIWVGYTLDSNEELKLVPPHIIEAENNESIPHFSSIFYDNEGKGNYFEIGIDEQEEFSNEVKLLCDIYKTYPNDDVKVATFEVPITLDKDIFKDKARSIDMKDKALETDIGLLSFYRLRTSTTRTSLEFALNSGKYKFMSFINPRLEDSTGMIYSIASGYSSETRDGRNKIDFQGEIKGDFNGLTFKCDGIYYLDSKEDFIIVDLKNKLVESNSLGFKFLDLENNKLTISSDHVASVSFCEVKDGEGKTIVQDTGTSSRVDNGKHCVESYLDLSNFTEDKLKLQIYWILDENKKTKPNSIKLN